MVGFRVVQAVGAAMIMAMGPAIVARTFPASERGRALGLNGVSVSIGLSLGPAAGRDPHPGCHLAGDLPDQRADRPAGDRCGRPACSRPRRRGRASRSIRGAALSGVALFALLLALSDGQQWGWASPPIIGLLVAFVVLGAAFIVAERARSSR